MVHMYVHGKIIPVETVAGMRGWMGEFKYDIL
jgi:hypothetical protein